MLQQGTKFLGICVGMQLLVDKGFEHGEHDGLGWIPGEVVKMQPSDKSLKIPHMGWNDIHPPTGQESTNHPVLQNDKNTQYFYFVHSYMVQLTREEDLLAVADYAGQITAAIGHKNIIGVQFHPEKSQDAGINLIRRFLHWTP